MTALKFAVVGFSQGYYATVYTTEMAKTKGVEIVGVCDLSQSEEYVKACAGITAQEFAQQLGVPLYHEVDDLLDTDVDMILVTTENVDHHRYAVRALEAGKHVLIGKPAAICADHMVEIMRVAESRDLIVLPGEPARYEDALMQAAKKISSGAIGKPIMGRVFVNHFAMTNHEWERDEERSGGPLAHFGTYACDILRWLMASEPVEIIAYGDNYCQPEINSWDNIKAMVKLENGSLGSIDLCCSIQWRYPCFDVEVIGEEGCVRTDYHNYPVVTYRRSDVEVEGPVISPIAGSTIHLNWREVHHFLDCVRGEAEPRITLFDAWKVTQMLDAIKASITSGKPVYL